MAEAYRKPNLFDLGLKAYRDSFRFSGRSTRTEVGAFILVSWLFQLVVGIAASFGDWHRNPAFPDFSLPIFLGLLAVQTLIFVPLIALTVRRGHDQGISGWFSVLVPLTVFAAAGWRDYVQVSTRAFDQPLAPAILGLVAFLALVVLLFAPPEERGNRYGPDPRIDRDSEG
jgi:uncharacterized membrane protein YhaH (DUF805 family)